MWYLLHMKNLDAQMPALGLAGVRPILPIQASEQLPTGVFLSRRSGRAVFALPAGVPGRTASVAPLERSRVDNWA